MVIVCLFQEYSDTQRHLAYTAMWLLRHPRLPLYINGIPLTTLSMSRHLSETSRKCNRHASHTPLSNRVVKFSEIEMMCPWEEEEEEEEGGLQF